MPTIANPRGGMDELWRGETRRGDAGLALRINVAFKSHALTRELADGADPASSPELALRAQQITSDASRRRLARTLRRTIAEARNTLTPGARMMIIRRGAVLDAQPTLEAMIERLGRPEPVSAEGMALVLRIITEGDSSPLYSAAEPGTLRRQALVATAALEPGYPHHGEFPLAA